MLCEPIIAVGAVFHEAVTIFCPLFQKKVNWKRFVSGRQTLGRPTEHPRQIG